MSMRTAKLQVSLQELSILRIEHPQANPLKLACTLRPGETLPSGLVITAEIHSSRNVPAETTPLASSSVTVAADATSFEVIFDSPQLNLTVTPESVRACWMVIYGVGDNVHTLAAADLLLGWHAISQVTAPPPAVTLFVEKGGVAWASGRTYASGTMVTVGTTAYVASSAHTSGSSTQPGTGASWATVWAVLIGDGGGGATNLTATASPTNVVIGSSTGNPATIPAADGTNAGLMLPAEKTKLAGVATGATANATDSFLRSRTNHTGTQATSTIDGLDSALAAKADLVDGKLNASQLPDLAVTQYLGTAVNQAAMLLLVGQQGDWCVRTDDGKVYVVTAQPSSTLSNWTSLSYPTAPVLSVAGRTGTITLSIGDITGLAGVLDTKVNSDALFALAFRDTIGTAQIDAGAVTELAIADGAVTASKLAAGAGTPAGSGTELQFRNAGAFAAVAGSSVSGSAVTFAELRVNPADAAQGLRMTSAANVASLFFLGTNANGFIYGQGNSSTASTATAVAVRAAFFRVEGISGADASAALQLGSSARVLLRPRALNNLALGPADAASPAAQSISVQNATGTNASAAAAVLCFDGAQGTGTAAGGDILFRVAPNGSTGATPNALTEAVRIRAVDRATVCAGAVLAGGPVTLATFTVATVPSASLWTRGLIYVSDESGGPTPAFSDGTNWRRVADRAVIASV